MVDQCAVVCGAAIYNGRLILAKAPERQCEAKLYNHTKEAGGAGEHWFWLVLKGKCRLM